MSPWGTPIETSLRERVEAAERDRDSWAQEAVDSSQMAEMWQSKAIAAEAEAERLRSRLDRAETLLHFYADGMGGRRATAYFASLESS